MSEYAVVIAARMNSTRLPGKALVSYTPDDQTNLAQIVTRWRELSRREPTVIVATTDVPKNKQQADLVNALLREKIPTVVVAVRGPYDLMYLKDAPTYLASYGLNPPSIEALAAVLMGKVKPRGRLPVELVAAVLIVGGLYYGINRHRIRQEKAARAEKRDRLGQWMQDKN